MKPLRFFWIALCAWSAPLFLSAQETTPATDFEQGLQFFNNAYPTAYNNQDYAQCETLIKDLLTLWQQHGQQPQYETVDNSLYYNLSCIQALQGKKEEAVESFLHAFDDNAQCISYQHVISDKDLTSIIDDERLQATLLRLKATTDYLYVLQQAPAYKSMPHKDTLPTIHYADMNDPDLQRVKAYFKLDSVAGNGDEISRIKNILAHIHNLIQHDGMHGNPYGCANAINFAEACKDGSRGLNCRGLATVLNECYLSVGIRSRVITCMPKLNDNDCHVINAVYSETLGKWLWIDPTHNAWVTDDKGNMLSIQEVRERLRQGLPVQVNEEANWNNRNKTDTEAYLYNYMAKNLYYLEGWDWNGFGTESHGHRPIRYIFLQPAGSETDMSQHCVVVTDEEYFWQSPK